MCNAMVLLFPQRRFPQGSGGTVGPHAALRKGPMVPRRLRLGQLLIAALALFVLGACEPAGSGSAGRDTDIGTVRQHQVQLGADRFAFPENAIPILRDHTGVQQTAALVLLYPTMEGRTQQNDWHFRVARQESRQVTVLLSVPRFNEPDILDQALRQRLFQQLGAGNRPGHLHELDADYEAVPAIGLTEYRLKPDADARHYERQKMRKGKRVFGRVKGGRLELVLICHTPQEYPNPQCGMRFPYRGLMVGLGFARPLMEEWSSIHEKVIAWLDAHRL